MKVIRFIFFNSLFDLYKSIINTTYFRFQWSYQNFKVNICLRSICCSITICYLIFLDFVFGHGCELFLRVVEEAIILVLLINVILNGDLMFLDGFIQALYIIVEVLFDFI